VKDHDSEGNAMAHLQWVNSTASQIAKFLFGRFMEEVLKHLQKGMKWYAFANKLNQH
jgi:hypothetical protein